MTTPVTVSKKTMNFVECLIMLSDFQNKMYESLKDMYGATQADDMLIEVYEKADPIKQLIKEYMCISIDDNICSNGFTEI
jgi:hypothetical protein